MLVPPSGLKRGEHKNSEREDCIETRIKHTKICRRIIDSRAKACRFADMNASCSPWGEKHGSVTRMKFLSLFLTLTIALSGMLSVAEAEPITPRPAPSLGFTDKLVIMSGQGSLRFDGGKSEKLTAVRVKLNTGGKAIVTMVSGDSRPFHGTWTMAGNIVTLALKPGLPPAKTDPPAKGAPASGALTINGSAQGFLTFQLSGALGGVKFTAMLSEGVR